MEQISLQDTDGFLSDKYSITVDKIKTNYKEWFSLVQKINCLIYDMYTNFDVKNNDTIGIYCLVFLKYINHFNPVQFYIVMV